MRHDPRPLRLRQPEDEDDLVSLRELASRLWRGRATIVLAGLLAAATAFLVTARLPERYTATARVMFAAEKPNVIDLEAILSDPAFSKDTLQNEIEVLRSTSLLDPSTADRFGIIGDTAMAMVNAEINRQAAMVAYIDDFWLMMWVTLAAVPLVLLLRPAQPGAPKASAADMGH